MTMPNAPGGATEANVPAPATGLPAGPVERLDATAGGRRRDEWYWLNRTFYIIGAVAGIGFLLVLLGAYAISNDAIVLAGAIIITLAVIAWIGATAIMIVMMLRHQLRPDQRTVGSRQSRRG